MLRVHIEGVLDPVGQRATGRRSLNQLKPEAMRLLSILARHGHADATSAQKAYVAGVQVMFFQTPAIYAPMVDWVAALDQVLPTLDALDGFGKELLLEALVTTASHDGLVSLHEAELIRAISACLHCPLPVLLTTTRRAS